MSNLAKIMDNKGDSKVENSADLAANKVLSFLSDKGFLNFDKIRETGWNLQGVELELRSIVKYAYSEPDEDIPFMVVSDGRTD
jgi:hypothetical protein